jgi:hypothetical protein
MSEYVTHLRIESFAHDESVLAPDTADHRACGTEVHAQHKLTAFQVPGSDALWLDGGAHEVSQDSRRWEGVLPTYTDQLDLVTCRRCLKSAEYQRRLDLTGVCPRCWLKHAGDC